MILGVGIDLVSIQKISSNIKKEAFQHNVFTPDEIAICQAFTNSTEHYAGKFAAKEAFMKAIGRGIRQEVWFTQIEVLNNKSGTPFINISGEAERVMKELGVVKIHLSVTHSDGLAVAVVILEA